MTSRRNAGPLRVLVTGFSAFPGAPCNPTEVLVADLAATRWFDPGKVEMALDVLPVEYARVPARLAELSAAMRPQVAIHFGLAASARGFRLERVAANACRPSLDAAGHMPPAAVIVDGGPARRSTLPMAAIHERLVEAGLPVEFSRDAGGYLCNYLFYLARSRLVAGYRPVMAGFVHVPYLDEQLVRLDDDQARGLVSIGRDDLLRGARLVIEASIAAARKRLGPKTAPATA